MAERRDPRSPGARPDHAGLLSEPGLVFRVSSGARRIFGQHRQLEDFSGMVASALARGSLRSTRLAFTRFRDALEAHITVEDQMFFPAVRGLRPGLDAHLAQLVLEHASFREHLDELHELLAKGSAEAFGESFVAFCADFAQHEAREEQIIAAASGPPRDPQKGD